MEYFGKSNASTTHPYYPIIDAHIHIRTLKRALNQNDVLKETGMRGFGIQCLPRLSDEFITNNICGPLLKTLLYGEIYCFGGFYRPQSGESARDQDYLAMMKRLVAMGCDGLKFYDAKPSVRKVLDMAIDAPEFQGVYKYMEEIGLPILIHVGDPANFWDGDDAPELAKEYGWTYNSTYVHPEQYYEEITNVMRKYKNLKLILAHFFFLSVDMPRLANFLDEFPSMNIDLTPGTEMYIDFAKNPDAWNEFFTKYQDRIIFGTDNGFFAESAYEVNTIRTFLETRNEFDSFYFPMRGIGLDEPVLRKIYYENYKKMVNQPRPVNFKHVIEEFDYVMKLAQNSELRDEILKDLDDIRNELQKIGVMD